MITKVAENLLRRRADRYGLRLVKSRSRDPKNVDFGKYALIDIKTGKAVNDPIAGRWLCSWTIDQVNDHITFECKRLLPTIFVVMGNDYPDAVFDTEEAAEEYCQKKRSEPKPRFSPGIYWRVYKFDLNTGAKDGQE